MSAPTGDPQETGQSDPIPSALRSRLLSRRGALAGALGGAGVALLGRAVAGQVTSPGITRGDCSKLPGLQLLFDWYARREILRHDELVPPLGWRLYSLSGMPVVFLYPSDWTPFAMWATGLTRSGAIAWQNTPSPSAYLVGARIVSPKQDALYEYVSGTLSGAALTLPQAETAAEQGVLGDGQTTDPICVYEDTTSFMHTWTRAGWYRDLAVVIGGNLYSDAGAYSPTTVISYQSFIGPESQFTELMRTVYIPIMFQFMMSRSSTIKPTPIPTPGF
ncbi:MAG: hypothetical protein QOF73_4674 [Thermomicrobiales bacterium]|nr:hypothetical protein [Thermomicrobiales bacterium]